MTDFYAVIVSEIPLGWTISQRHNAHNAMRTQLGDQSTPYPNLRMHIRPNVATTYDEDGEPTSAATAWILAGDLSNVTRAQVVDVVAAALNVNPTAVDAKIQLDWLTHAELLSEIASNKEFWSEGE